MKKIHSIDRILLLDLYRSEDGLDFSTFYLRYRIPPAQLFVSIRRLEGRDMVQKDNFRLLLTDEGRAWIQSSGMELAIAAEDKSWRKVPTEFCVRPKDPFEPYAPMLSRLRKGA